MCGTTRGKKQVCRNCFKSAVCAVLVFPPPILTTTFWRRNRVTENVMMAAKRFSPGPRLFIQFSRGILPPRTWPPAGSMRRRSWGSVSRDFLYPTSPEWTALCYQLADHVLVEASWPNCTLDVVLVVELRLALLALSTFLHEVLRKVLVADHANYRSQVLCSLSDYNVHVWPSHVLVRTFLVWR